MLKPIASASQPGVLPRRVKWQKDQRGTCKKRGKTHQVPNPSSRAPSSRALLVVVYSRETFIPALTASSRKISTSHPRLGAPSFLTRGDRCV